MFRRSSVEQVKTPVVDPSSTSRPEPVLPLAQARHPRTRRRAEVELAIPEPRRDRPDATPRSDRAGRRDPRHGENCFSALGRSLDRRARITLAPILTEGIAVPGPGSLNSDGCKLVIDSSRAPPRDRGDSCSMSTQSCASSIREAAVPQSEVRRPSVASVPLLFGPPSSPRRPRSQRDDPLHVDSLTAAPLPDRPAQGGASNERGFCFFPTYESRQRPRAEANPAPRSSSFCRRSIDRFPVRWPYSLKGNTNYDVEVRGNRIPYLSVNSSRVAGRALGPGVAQSGERSLYAGRKRQTRKCAGGAQ